MKGYYEATRKKPQTVGEFLKKTSERNYARDQIDKHNMKEGTTNLKMVKDTIYHQNSGGWTELNMLHDPIMEMNALEAIRMVTPVKHNSIYPSLAQIYTVRRADERAILQNPENLNREVFLTQDLKTKLLKYKRESIDTYEKDRYWPSDQNYSAVLDKEYAEIQWLQMFKSTQNDFFNSEYVRGFGLVFQYNPHENQGQNQPLPLPQATNHNPEPNPDEEELMLKELRAQLEQMRQEIENKNNDLADKDKALEDKDHQLQAEKDKNSDLTDKLASEKILTKELTDKNDDLTDQVKNLTVKVSELTEKLDVSEEKNAGLQSKFDESQAKVRPLEEKVLDLKHYNKQLEDDKIDLRETQKDMREVQKMLIEDKKNLASEKKMLEDKAQLLSIDKKHFHDLSLEQAIKITQLEQVHCNDPEHFEIIQSGQVNYTD